MKKKSDQQRQRRRARRAQPWPRMPRKKPGGTPVDLRGQVFEALTVLKILPRQPGRTHRYWRCQCTCGRLHDVRSNNLIAGVIRCCSVCAQPKSEVSS